MPRPQLTGQSSPGNLRTASRIGARCREFTKSQTEDDLARLYSIAPWRHGSSSRGADHPILKIVHAAASEHNVKVAETNYDNLPSPKNLDVLTNAIGKWNR